MIDSFLLFSIKIAYVNAFSGPAAINGYLHFAPIAFAAHDINKRGGIWVDGKKKLVTVIKADHQSKPDICKKVCERLVLQDKVHVLMGTSGSNLMKIINEVANKYNVISVNEGALADDLMTAHLDPGRVVDREKDEQGADWIHRARNHVNAKHGVSPDSA